MKFTQIHLHNLRRSDALTQRIQQLSEKLETRHPQIMTCRVNVEGGEGHAHKGRPVTVTVTVHLPGREVVATQRDEDVRVALRDAFVAAERQVAPDLGPGKGIRGAKPIKRSVEAAED